MAHRVYAGLLLLIAGLGHGCAARGAPQAGGDGVTPGLDGGGEVPDAGMREDAGADAPAVDAALDVGTTPDAAVSMVFPQALGGAFFANPTVYSQIPVRVRVEENVDAVEIENSGTVVAATLEDVSSRTWVASVTITGLAEGPHSLEATALRGGHPAGSATVTLGVNHDGIQITNNAVVDILGTPRAHRVGDALALTWTDRRSDRNAQPWLELFDGAGRSVGARVSMVASEQETLYARVAFASNRAGVLYQQHGSPYRTYFTIVNVDGTQLLAPLALDPEGSYGSRGGDIVHDGSGFVACYRTRSSTAPGAVRWLRVDDDGTITGPIVVATAQEDSVIGDFPPQSPVGVAAIGDTSVVTFVRERWNSWLDMALPKSQVARVTSDGVVHWVEYAGDETDYTLHREARVWAVRDGFFLLWGAQDVLDGEAPPMVFYGALANVDGELPQDRGAGDFVVDAPDDREEPFAVKADDGQTILAWLDHRSYTLAPSSGEVELYAATVDASLDVGEETVFPDARFYSGLASLHGVAVGTNVILVWLDQRNALGTAYEPEIWLETVWR